jgi:small subunit ribosomal protein S20
MANHTSSLKRIRQDEKKNSRNSILRSKFRTELKKYWQLIDKKMTAEGQKQLPLIHKSIDKARSKGIIKKNLASRKKSQVTRWLQKLLQSAESAKTPSS